MQPYAELFLVKDIGCARSIREVIGNWPLGGLPISPFYKIRKVINKKQTAKTYP